MLIDNDMHSLGLRAAPSVEEPTPLRIVVVGGGIGGLVTAISLRQQGHVVEIFEQSRFANEIGAAIHLVPNAMTCLSALGIDPEAHGANELLSTKVRTSDSAVIATIDHSERRKRFGNPWYLTHRAHLHNHLKTVTTSLEGEGIPVQLYCSSNIASVDPHKGMITLLNGEEHYADVIIGADGVHSTCRGFITDAAPQAKPSGQNTFRFLVKREHVTSDPETRPFSATDGCMDMWYSTDRKVVVYPCARNTVLNFVCIHPAELTDGLIDGDGDSIKRKMMEVFQKFHPGLLRIMSRAEPSSLKVWPLLDMKTLPQYSNDRLALIGDAAHPFLPHLAQGGAMAIEDGCSIGVMLSRGATAAEVPERLRLYNKARHERATLCQEYTRLTGQDSASSTDTDASKMNLNDTLEHFLPHDEVKYSAYLLRRHLWQKQSALRYRQPTIFGPICGPRQIPRDATLGGKPSSTITATIRIQTSATLVSTLFPNDSYSFPQNKSIAEVSFILQSLRDLDWLGGLGYDLFTFCIHGVTYTKKDRTKKRGTFIAVTWENLCEPIITGREELGWPKLWSDIDITYPAVDGLRATFAWNNAMWGALWLDALQSDTAVEATTDDHVGREQAEDGFFLHRYCPSSTVGDHPQADAEYDVFIPAGKSRDMSAHHHDHARPVLSKQVALRGGVMFKALGWKKLPTLQHIVSRLEELPQYGLVEASLTTASGASDLSGGERL